MEMLAITQKAPDPILGRVSHFTTKVNIDNHGFLWYDTTGGEGLIKTKATHLLLHRTKAIPLFRANKMLDNVILSWYTPMGGHGVHPGKNRLARLA